MINLNECKFGDKLLMSDGEMGIYAGWYHPMLDIESLKRSKDRLHSVIFQRDTYFGFVQTDDFGISSNGKHEVIDRWNEDEHTRLISCCFAKTLEDINSPEFHAGINNGFLSLYAKQGAELTWAGKEGKGKKKKKTRKR